LGEINLRQGRDWQSEILGLEKTEGEIFCGVLEKKKPEVAFFQSCALPDRGSKRPVISRYGRDCLASRKRGKKKRGSNDIEWGEKKGHLERRNTEKSGSNMILTAASKKRVDNDTAKCLGSKRIRTSFAGKTD